MCLKVLSITSLLLFCYTENFSQDYFSYGGGNFCGLNQVISNPAAAADNRLVFDLTLGGLDVNFNNSWFAVKRAALTPTRSAGALKFPATWNNLTPNVPDNVYKNFNVLSSANERAVIIENRVVMPSAMLRLNSKNSIAFTWSIRQIANVDGVSQQLATLFEKELDLSVTQNNQITNKTLAVVQMAWAEYGLTYARVLKDNNKHFIKAGITPKLLQGLESAYMVIKDLDFYLSNQDTSSYLNANVSYARSANFNSPISNGKVDPAFYKFTGKPSLGLDLGFIYEWRPHFEKYRYKTESGQDAWRNDLNKYKLKLGVSVVDIGKIKFNKAGKYYDLDIVVKNSDITKFFTVSNLAMLDSMLRADYSSKNQKNDYSILLPAAINTQVDYSFNRFFYLNLSAHLGNFYQSNSYRVHNYSAICFAPRVEHYWFNVSLPLTFNALSAKRFKYLAPGLNLRLGPLCIGSNNLTPFFKGDISSFNFYALLKISIPYKRFKDRDGDRMPDKKDQCPDDAGEIVFGGCPDADHDKIPDKDDGCPHQPGIAAQRGCPDADHDGLIDGDDACPRDSGAISLKGCPDNDNDGIINKNDSCPGLKGLVKYNGCPDTDGDQVHDGEDNCATIAGPPENKGCPWSDTDKDGIIDKQDSCINIAGTLAFKGCPPPPPKLALVEKRVLEKAFSNLRFESAKDIIKTSSFPYLNSLATLLVGKKSEWKIKLSGHTDNEGTAAGNLILSEKRVKAVQKYLVKRGVPPENISIEWFGQTQPVADNLTKEGKQKNRRVEMLVLMKEQ